MGQVTSDDDEARGVGNGPTTAAAGRTTEYVCESADLLVVEVAGDEPRVVRVIIDGRTYYGKRVEVTGPVDVPETKLVRWDELQDGGLYVDRDLKGEVSGVLQVSRDGTLWRWIWTPWMDWDEGMWHDSQSEKRDADAERAEFVGVAEYESIVDDEATVRASCEAFDAWAAMRGVVLRRSTSG